MSNVSIRFPSLFPTKNAIKRKHTRQNICEGFLVHWIYHQMPSEERKNMLSLDKTTRGLHFINNQHVRRHRHSNCTGVYLNEKLHSPVASRLIIESMLGLKCFSCSFDLSPRDQSVELVIWDGREKGGSALWEKQTPHNQSFYARFLTLNLFLLSISFWSLIECLFSSSRLDFRKHKLTIRHLCRGSHRLCMCWMLMYR